MFHCLYYSDRFDDYKKMRNFFCRFSAIKNIVPPSSFYNLSMKLIC